MWDKGKVIGLEFRGVKSSNQPTYYRLEKVTGRSQESLKKWHLLHTEARLGELLAGLPKPKPVKDTDGSLRGTVGTLPPNITKKDSHYGPCCKEGDFLRVR